MIAKAGDHDGATPYRPLLWLALVVGLGIEADRELNSAGATDLFGWWWGGAAAALLLAITARRRRRFDVAAALLLAAAGGIGGAWHHWRWNFASPDNLTRFATEDPQPACIEAVLDDPVGFLRRLTRARCGPSRREP